MNLRPAPRGSRRSNQARRSAPRQIPVVDISLVHDPSAHGPVLEPRIVRTFPKPSTRLSRAIAKKAARLDDAKQLRAWAAAVKQRDGWKDRRTGVRLLRTLSLDPLRAEAHHVVSRSDPAVRYDVRNGITLSLETHDQVERGLLRIEGTAFFRVGGVRYIDASEPVLFVRA